MNSKGKQLVVILSVLLLINMYVINIDAIFESRIIRFITILVFYVVFLFYKGYKERWIFISFSCFFISDFPMIFYEHPVCNKITSIIAICGYFSLSYHVYRKSQVRKIKPRLVFIYVFLTLLNFYALYEILNSINNLLHDNIQKILLYIYGTTMIAICVAAANYNFRYGIKKSMYFMFFVFGFAFADLCAVLAYYFNFYMLYYLDRIIYLFALFFMVNYILIKPDNRKNYWIED